jgi:hypothetical protein
VTDCRRQTLPLPRDAFELPPGQWPGGTGESPVPPRSYQISRPIWITRCLLPLLLAGAAFFASAAQIKFDFGQTPDGHVPDGFLSLVSGPGRPGNWKVLDEMVPTAMAPILTNLSGPSLTVAKHTVLAASSTNAAATHSPILLFTNELFGDFTLTTRFKILGGTTAPEAGIAFRVQDESNYYVLRASTRGSQTVHGSLLWYRVVGGVRYDTIGKGVLVPIPPDDWQELRVECVGNSIRGYLNGKLMIPPMLAGAPTNEADLPRLNDTTFPTGRAGFWTAADTTAYFADTRIDYTGRVPLIQTVIDGVVKKYPRLLGLRVYALKNSSAPVVVADAKEQDLGSPGGKTEADVLADGKTYYLKQGKTAEVTLPLRDRNGDVLGALKVTLATLTGETQDTSVARAVVIKKAVETGLSTLQDINE